MYYFVCPDGSVIYARTKEELAVKIKEYREGTH